MREVIKAAAAAVKANNDLVEALIALLNAPQGANGAKPVEMPDTSSEPAPTAPQGADSGADDAPDILRVQAALVDLAKAKGRAAAAEVLMGHGANKLPDLKPDQYASVIDDAFKRMGA